MSASLDRIAVRPAIPADEEFLLSWRNLPWVVALGASQRTVTSEEHHRWFGQTLQGESRRLFVVEKADDPIGVIRYDGLTSGAIEVSLSLLPDHIGKGVGAAALRLSLAALGAWGAARPIEARVLATNERSLSFFRRMGFAVVAEGAEAGLVRLILDQHLRGGGA